MLRGRAEVTTHTLINITLISGQVSVCWASSLIYTDISACWGHRTHDSVVMDSSVVQWLTKQCISQNTTESVRKKSAPLIKEEFACKNWGIISFLVYEINDLLNASFFLRCTSLRWQCLNDFICDVSLKNSFLTKFLIESLSIEASQTENIILFQYFHRGQNPVFCSLVIVSIHMYAFRYVCIDTETSILNMLTASEM